MPVQGGDPDEMSRYRVTWSKIVGLIAVDPEVAKQRSDLEMLKKALPEVTKVQPRGLYREVIVTASCHEPRFARDVGGLVAAPTEQELGRVGRQRRIRMDALRRALCVPPPAYVEDSEVGPGLCCACGKAGVLGRCTRCGLLMHYSCVAPILPGRPQPCPRCRPVSDEELEETSKQMLPHQLELGGAVQEA